MPFVQVVCQRTQSTPQHNDRLHPWETLCLTHLFASAFNQILSFSVGLNISGSPIFFYWRMTLVHLIRNVVGFLAFKPFWFSFFFFFGF